MREQGIPLMSTAPNFDSNPALRAKFKFRIDELLHISAAAGLKSGQSNRIKKLNKYNFIFLTGSTGWTGYNQTEQKKILLIL